MNSRGLIIYLMSRVFIINSISKAMNNKPIRVVVTSQEMVQKPINPMIYGGFLEIGWGRQIDGIWSEMFYNRSFEKVPPYAEIMWYCLSRNAKDDLTKEAWYHSGYEEKPWYLIPGNPDAKLYFSDHAGIFHGQRGVWLINKSEDKNAGFGQDGIFLKKGEKYIFRGALRTGQRVHDLSKSDVTLNAEIQIYPEGKFDNPILTAVNQMYKARDVTREYM